MTQAYWIGQFILVALFYGFVMFLWPSVVFSKFLTGRSRTFRFAFCTNGMIVLINLAVLIVGLIPFALHSWITAIIFYGAFFIQLWRQSEKERSAAKNALERLFDGAMKHRSLVLFLGQVIKKGLCYIFRKIRNLFEEHRMEYCILVALCAYAILYFSWGAFDLHSFGASDMYVHHSWIYGLQHGKIFYAGIYPEGMHTFIYLMNSISGIRVYSLLLLLGGIHSAVLIVSMWLFLKEVFHWRYSALVTVLLFLILEQNSLNDIYAMSRIQWTVPQEFALFTEFLCGAFLVRYLKERGDSKENLRMFGLTIAASFATHFYVTIMAAILCVGVILSRFGAFWQKWHWRKLLVTALIAVAIPLVPMVGAFAEGHPLQGSLGWAIGVMQGTKSDANTDKTEKEESSSEAESTNSETEEEKPKTAFGRYWSEEKDIKQDDPLAVRLRKLPVTLYRYGFLTIYGTAKSKIFTALVYIVFLSSFALKLVVAMASRFFGKRHWNFMDGALAVSAAAVLFMLDFVAQSAKLPQIIAGPRILTSERLMVLASCMMLPDLALLGALHLVRHFGWQRKKFIRPVLLHMPGVAVILAVYAIVVFTGNYHGYLYYVQTRYPEAADTTNRIIHENPRRKYTIVSTTDELYQVNQYGFHEELLTLVQLGESYVGYSIPTEYIYVFIEKRPLKYASTHFFRGPSWLAVNEKNYDFFRHFHMTCSESPNTVSGKISKKQAEKKLKYEIGDSSAGEDLKGRIVLESKAMRWMEKFQEYYPDSCGIYFEDDNFVCYKIRQDAQIPYRLGFFVKK